MIYALNAVDEKLRPSVGQKTMNIAWMRQHGLAVPDGFVIGADVYHEAIKYNGYENILYDLSIQVPNREDELLRFSSLMVQSILALEFPEPVIQEIKRFWDEMGSPAVMVRFSDFGNGLSVTNYTGRLRGATNVKEFNEILLGIKLSWSKLWTEEAIRFRQSLGYSHQRLLMAVIVQRYVEGEVSGLLYTANPRNNRSDQVVIRSTWGLGEALVRDEVRPDHWVLDTDGSIYQASIMVKHDLRQSISDPRRSGSERSPVPAELRTVSTLEEGQISELLNIASLLIDSFPGEPQVVEWTYVSKKLFLLQLRPLGTMYPRIDNLPEDDTQREESRIYLQFNQLIGTRAPFTPLGLSLWSRLLCGVMEEFTGKPQPDEPSWLSRAGNRLWIDITNQLLLPPKRSFLLSIVKDRRPEGNGLLSRTLLQYRSNIRSMGTTIGDIRWRLIWRNRAVGFRSPTKAAFRLKKSGSEMIAVLEKGSSGITTLAAALSWLDNSVPLIARMLLDQVSYAIPALISLAKIEAEMKRWPVQPLELDSFRQLPYNNPIFEIARHLYVASTYYLESNRELTEEHSDLYGLTRYIYHYGLCDFDPGSKRWHEERNLVESLIEALNVMKENPDHSLDTIRALAQQMADHVPKLADKYRGIFARKQMEYYCSVAKALAGSEQQILETITQIVAIIRRVFVQIGADMELRGSLEKAEAIFMLSLEELHGDNSGWARLSQENKLNYEAEQARTLVPWLLISSGEALYSETSDLPHNQICGLPLNGGVYTGKVRVITEESLPYAERGEVYVINHFNAEWDQKLNYAGALILEREETNSYLGVLGRIFATPAVRGVTHAAEILHDGMMVRIDGRTGLVTILEMPPGSSEVNEGSDETIIPTQA